MKKGKYHIVCSWILLICFVAGQYMIYAHQHSVIKNSTKVYSIAKTLPQSIVQEKCSLCDVMHHNVMVINSQVYFNPVVISMHVFKSVTYKFRSIQLVLAAGRAPPHAIYIS